MCLHKHPLAVAGSRVGLEAHTYSNELSLKWLPSQDLLCGGIIASAVYCGYSSSSSSSRGTGIECKT